MSAHWLLSLYAHQYAKQKAKQQRDGRNDQQQPAHNSCWCFPYYAALKANVQVPAESCCCPILLLRCLLFTQQLLGVRNRCHLRRVEQMQADVFVLGKNGLMLPFSSSRKLQDRTPDPVSAWLARRHGARPFLSAQNLSDHAQSLFIQTLASSLRVGSHFAPLLAFFGVPAKKVKSGSTVFWIHGRHGS